MYPFSAHSSTSDVTEQKALDQYRVDLESRSHRYWRSLLSRLRPKKQLDVRQIWDGFYDAFLITLIFIAPNIVAITMAYFFVYGSVFPLSSVAAALHYSRGSWIAYQVFLPLFTLAASFINVCFLVATFQIITHSYFLMFLTTICAFTPLWVPYVTNAALRKYHFDHDCDSFDGTVYLDAVRYNSKGLSQATFSRSFGGQQWQLWQSSQGTYQFAQVGTESGITYNFRTQTYNVANSSSEVGVLTNKNEPLEFPAFGLFSDSDWIRSCYAPAVELKNSSGHVIVRTGLSTYTDCSNMRVCINKTWGKNAIFVAIGRILIALEDAADCCTRR